MALRSNRQEQQPDSGAGCAMSIAAALSVVSDIVHLRRNLKHTARSHTIVVHEQEIRRSTAVHHFACLSHRAQARRTVDGIGF